MTPLFFPAASIMLVGCEADLAADLARVFPHLLVLNVAHASAAVERMLVTRPLVVIVSVEITRSIEDKIVVECARDIRCEVVRISSVGREEFEASIRAALLIAERNREEPTLPPTSP
jgi:hypothetical protein